MHHENTRNLKVTFDLSMHIQTHTIIPFILNTLYYRSQIVYDNLNSIHNKSKNLKWKSAYAMIQCNNTPKVCKMRILRDKKLFPLIKKLYLKNA